MGRFHWCIVLLSSGCQLESGPHWYLEKAVPGERVWLRGARRRRGRRRFLALLGPLERWLGGDGRGHARALHRRGGLADGQSASEECRCRHARWRGIANCRCCETGRADGHHLQGRWKGTAGERAAAWQGQRVQRGGGRERYLAVWPGATFLHSKRALALFRLTPCCRPVAESAEKPQSPDRAPAVGCGDRAGGERKKEAGPDDAEPPLRRRGSHRRNGGQAFSRVWRRSEEF
mmetsp:Transcript_21967/g.61430  ORF Transcript_21967/g.61430 Transcript_21967/m.61430 type:complete len:233 (-) Transcript_21967:593-1291(-)